MFREMTHPCSFSPANLACSMIPMMQGSSRSCCYRGVDDWILNWLCHTWLIWSWISIPWIIGN